MHAAFVDGHLVDGIVNVVLYTALLLLTLRLRPTASLFSRSQLEQHSLVAERPLQHVYQLILFFSLSRLFWASWVLAHHNGDSIKVPADAVGFYTDSLGTSAFFVGVFLVVTQVRVRVEAGVRDKVRSRKEGCTPCAMRRPKRRERRRACRRRVAGGLQAGCRRVAGLPAR